MVFSSVPIYLDPHNWNQEVSSQQEAAGEAAAAAAAHQVVVQQPRHEGNSVGVGGSSSSSRAGASMAERARQAKVAQPEAGLKCPRCDSTNTKFCYFNNYSLSQPRHFCKTCRRYWTRGGALRSVPVGGGCRRNKRSKGGNAATKSSSSSCSDVRQQPAPAATSTSSHHHLPLPPQLPFMTSLHPLNLGAAIQTLDAVDFQVGTSCSGAGLEQWRVQQFPFLAGLMEPASVGMFPFEGEGVEGVVGGGAFAGQVHGRASASGLITHLASVKMEESPQEQQLILPKQYLGIPGTGSTTTNTTTDHYWGGVGGGGSSSGGWVDLSGFNPSSTSNIL